MGVLRVAIAGDTLELFLCTGALLFSFPFITCTVHFAVLLWFQVKEANSGNISPAGRSLRPARRLLPSTYWLNSRSSSEPEHFSGCLWHSQISVQNPQKSMWHFRPFAAVWLLLHVRSLIFKDLLKGLGPAGCLFSTICCSQSMAFDHDIFQVFPHLAAFPSHFTANCEISEFLRDSWDSCGKNGIVSVKLRHYFVNKSGWTNLYCFWLQLDLNTPALKVSYIIYCFILSGPRN